MQKRAYFNTVLGLIFFISSIWVSEADGFAGEFPLSTQGRYIVDQKGERFKLKSVNWYGSHLASQVPGGLDQQSIDHIIGLIKQLGFNSVRFPFSNAMLHDQRPVDPQYVRANPQLIGMTPLMVMDEVIAALTKADLAVILNNHSTTSEWCCGYDYNGLWYHTGVEGGYNQTTEMWQEDWLNLVRRYKNNKAVVGADLRNEVRTTKFNDTVIPESPNWGWGNKNDWHKAAEDLGNLILAENPDMLIVVEGINWWGMIPILGSGERPHLAPVAGLPVRLIRPNKLVYGVHNYSHIGPKHNGDDKTSGSNPRYAHMDENQFYETMSREWTFVLQNRQHYTAPVWMSEFGIGRDDSVAEGDKEWFRRLVKMLVANDIDFAYWPLNAEGYGLVTDDWSSVREDWRSSLMARLVGATDSSPTVTPDILFTGLDISKENDNQSTLQQDWLAGANKGTCPIGYRVVGLSRDYKGVCIKDVNQAMGWSHDSGLVVQAVYETAAREHTGSDWASGVTKYECPRNMMAVGFSKHHWGISGILCAASSTPLGGSCQTLWLDKNDARSSQGGGDWAIKGLKLQCRDDQYVAGVGQRDGKLRALLCCGS
jgi:aryl-phospho-beta-D-glucosidase BglC (GH1 family)